MRNNKRFLISELDSKDWLKYKEIRLKTIKNEKEAFSNIYDKLLKYGESDWKNILNDKDSTFLLAESNSKPVGIIRVTFNDEDVDEDTAYIGGLYVEREYRNMGIASSLLDMVIDESRKREGINRMKLWVRESQTDAIRLYEEFGFKKVGESKDISEDNTEIYTEIIMEKSC